MAQGTARGPSASTDPISQRSVRPTEAAPADVPSHRAESIAFLENAACHLRDAGYFVELDFDAEADEACLYVDGVEVRFVKCLPVATQKPLKH
jgi:hypothetical protein